MTFPDIFEGKLSKQIEEKLMAIKNDNIQSKEVNNGMSLDKINEIENILINDFKNGINYELFYKYILSLLTNNTKQQSKEKININIIKKLIIKARLMNIFLLKAKNDENSDNIKIKNLEEIINLNESLLKLFDDLLIDKEKEINNKFKEIFDLNTNNKFLISLLNEKTPQISINKLEENQIYTNIKRGNKCFPFVLEFNIIIHYIHNLFEFKKEKEKNDIFLRNLFHCYIISNKDMQIFEIDLFNSNLTISSSLEKDYISLKYKGSLFLSNYKNPRDGINEFTFYLEFKDKSKYKQNEIKKITFNIDI